MKRSFLFVLILLIGLSCQSRNEQNTASPEAIPDQYAEEIISSGAITVEEMFSQFEASGVMIKERA